MIEGVATRLRREQAQIRCALTHPRESVTPKAVASASACRPKAYFDSPGGFEGFGAVGEDMGAADLPVFEVVDAVRAATLRGLR
jgi:hypothetical protein